MEMNADMPQPASGFATHHDRPPRATRVILAPEPWGGFQQPALQCWAMARARRDLVIYLGPQLTVPRAQPTSGVATGTLQWADADAIVRQWINVTGHWAAGVYVLQRLDYFRLAEGPGPLYTAAGLMEQWIASVASGALEVIRGFAAAQWLGPPPARTVEWAADPCDVGSGPPPIIPPPWPAAPEHPLAIVAGARAGHRAWLQQLSARAPAWRWLVPEVPSPPDAASAWPDTAFLVPWPLAADAVAQARAASAVVVPPKARAAGLAPWRTLPEARQLPWIGPGAGEAFVATWLSADTPLACARALGLLTWAEPRPIATREENA